MPGYVEANYAASMLEWARQTFDGRMGYSAVTTDTVATLLGRPPIRRRALDKSLQAVRAAAIGADHSEPDETNG